MYKQLNIHNKGVVGDYIPKGYAYEDGIVFSSSHSSWESVHEPFKQIAKDIIELYPSTKTILDLGSGAGNFRYELMKINPELNVITIDGNPTTMNSPLIDKEKHFVLRTDNTYIILDENDDILKFDLICSFEHFEHIEPENLHAFINNIIIHSHENTVLYATASYAPGPYHCNIKSFEEWDNLLTNKYDMQQIDIKLLDKYEKMPLRYHQTNELHYLVFSKPIN